MSLGKAYLEVYDVSTLPGSADVHVQVYVSVRTIPDNEGSIPAAKVAAKAARDAFAHHLEQELLSGGGRHE